jgi:hypothetical protein
MTSILRRPSIPQVLREAAARRTLIPFVGAGASKLAGCPDWKEFADDALQDLIGAGHFKYGQVEQIKDLGPRTKLSIARAIARQTGATINFRGLLHRAPLEKHEDGNRLYRAILALSNVVVTTNYDCWLDQTPRIPTPTEPHETAATTPVDVRRKVVWKPEDFLPSLLTSENTVIHLHGSVEDPRSMVLTTQDYLQHYQNDRGGDWPENRVLTFLEQLFRQKNVLFIGYGLEELEVLEYVVLKARVAGAEGDGTAQAPRHFMLQGYFSHQEELVRNLEPYYRAFGIELIPFQRDELNWRELINVVEDLARQIPTGAPLLLEQYREMDALLDD